MIESPRRMDTARLERTAHHHGIDDHRTWHGQDLIGLSGASVLRQLQPLSLLGAAGFIELIGGALLIIGLWTQPAAFIAVR